MKLTTSLITGTFLSLAATSAFAEAHMDPMSFVPADKITDGAIYRMDVAEGDTVWSGGTAYQAVDTSWTKVGEIDDILLDREGKMVALLAEVGGFLGIGERDVIIPLDSVRFAIDDAKSYAYVTNLTEEQLKALPEIDDDIWD